MILECVHYDGKLSACRHYAFRQSLLRREGRMMDLDAGPDDGQLLRMAGEWFQRIASMSVAVADE